MIPRILSHHAWKSVKGFDICACHKKVTFHLFAQKSPWTDFYQTWNERSRRDKVCDNLFKGLNSTGGQSSKFFHRWRRRYNSAALPRSLWYSCKITQITTNHGIWQNQVIHGNCWVDVNPDCGLLVQLVFVRFMDSVPFGSSSRSNPSSTCNAHCHIWTRNDVMRLTIQCGLCNAAVETNQFRATCFRKKNYFQKRNSDKIQRTFAVGRASGLNKDLYVFSVRTKRVHQSAAHCTST